MLERKVVKAMERSFLSGQLPDKKYAISKSELHKLESFVQSEEFALLKRIFEQHAKGITYQTMVSFERIKDMAEDSKIVRVYAEHCTEFKIFTTIADLERLLEVELDRRKKEETNGAKKK